MLRIACVVGCWLVLAAWCSQPGLADPPRPNVLLIVADDLGFSDLGCYGSEIATPTLDSLASRGTVFSNFHAAATCSPSRAMLLTGIDHHRAGMGTMYEYLDDAPAQIDQPGYEGSLNGSVVTIAEVLKQAGYHTAISGKWHLGHRLVVSQGPVGRGFDQSWTLWSGWARHFVPDSYTVFVEGRYRVAYPDGRYSTEWYTDKAIEFVNEAAARDKPFFLYVAYTAPHWPLEAPVDAIAQQKGRYDAGHDELLERRVAGLIAKGVLPAGFEAASAPPMRPMLHHDPPWETTRVWADLDDDERAYAARLMEIYAAMVESLDKQIGRLLDHLERSGQLDNTLIVFLSDNGPSSASTDPRFPGNQLENAGRPGSFVAYGAEWARASSGGLRLMKGYSTEGGTRVPAIVKLPGDTRHRLSAEFASVLDIAPTIYEVVGAAYPESCQGRDVLPLAGTSMLAYLSGKSATIHWEDYAMGWELFGRAAFRRGPWKITWVERPFGTSDFELFDIDRDPGETRDVRRDHPEVYQQMLDGFDEYRRANGVVIVRPESWN